MRSQTRRDIRLPVHQPAMRAAAPCPPAREQAPAARLAGAASRCACGGVCPRCGGGTALDAPVRQRLEARLGAPLNDVRVHADAAGAHAAAARQAHAFTLGEDVFFAAGKFAPRTTEGEIRLAHELVHVVQQRRGRRGVAPGTDPAAEREARRLGAAIAAGTRVTVRGAAAPAPQHDGAETAAGSSADPAGAGPRLHLDPEIEHLMLQHFIRWWLGSTLVLGQAPATTPPVAEDDASADAPYGSGPGGVFVPPRLPPLPPLQPSFFAPLPPDKLILEPDVGALFAPFGARGAPVGAGDAAVVMDLYRRNAAIASQLPDLRSMAPGFIKPLIPLTWRRDIAGALTGAAVDASLKHDFMSPIDVADRAWEGMTGAGTTVIPFPSFSF